MKKLLKNVINKETLAKEFEETFRSHRFYIEGDDAFLRICRINIYEQQVLGVVFYFTQRTIGFISQKKYPKNLIVNLLDGIGNTQGKIIFKNIKFISNNLFGCFKLDYTTTEIQTIEVMLKYSDFDIVPNL